MASRIATILAKRNPLIPTTQRCPLPRVQRWVVRPASKRFYSEETPRAENTEKAKVADRGLIAGIPVENRPLAIFIVFITVIAGWGAYKASAGVYKENRVEKDDNQLKEILEEGPPEGKGDQTGEPTKSQESKDKTDEGGKK